MQQIVREILQKRGLKTKAQIAAFLQPDYQASSHDPFLLPDMAPAVERIAQAIERGEQITVYGDYDIDGMTATTLLLEALRSFGAKQVTQYTPDRFAEGYGLNMAAIEQLAESDTELLITVDCGSLSHAEIALANSFNIDVIVTDHHNVAAEQPPALAVINPKRADSKYPFRELAGVGVAFKLVQALQQTLPGCLPKGQEKWWLDLVALGTVCDLVPLLEENRSLVFWGLQVLAKTRRPGLRALMAVGQVRPERVSARDVGFRLGPRMNAAGRLETATAALRLLQATNETEAFDMAQKLDQLNQQRRAEQERIYLAAIEVIEQNNHLDDAVLVVAGVGWSHGVVGIVASKLLEKYQKPVFVLEELPDGTAKGSGRSFGEFNLGEAVAQTKSWLQKGGGHAAAAGVALASKKLPEWRQAINQYYQSQELADQSRFLAVQADVVVKDFAQLKPALVKELSALEPFGLGNPEPVLAGRGLRVVARRTMGDRRQHLKLSLADQSGQQLQLVAWGAAEAWSAAPGEVVRQIWFTPTLNEWNGRVTVEGQMLDLQI